MASFDGLIALRPPMEGPGPVPTVVVDRFVGVWPNQTCERAMSRASFADKYWRMVKLLGKPVVAEAGRRKPHLVLSSRDGSYAGSAGCGRFDGRYRVEGPALGLDPPAPGSTPSCPSDVAQAWNEAVASTRRWSIDAQVMEWFDEQGRTVAVFEAVYLW